MTNVWIAAANKTMTMLIYARTPRNCPRKDHNSPRTTSNNSCKVGAPLLAHLVDNKINKAKQNFR